MLVFTQASASTASALLADTPSLHPARLQHQHRLVELQSHLPDISGLHSVASVGELAVAMVLAQEQIMTAYKADSELQEATVTDGCRGVVWVVETEHRRKSLPIELGSRCSQVGAEHTSLPRHMRCPSLDPTSMATSLSGSRWPRKRRS